MLGVVACESLYSELEALVPEADVRYVPPELHEFPMNVPNEAAITEGVQRAIDELDRPEVDRIVVLYANDGDGLSGLVAEHAPLYVSQVDDCISLFLHGVEPVRMGEVKAPGTYYLSRGWIDCGVDAYKLFRTYRGEADDLITWFERAAADHPDLRVSWPDGDRYSRARAEDRSLPPELVGRFFHEVVGYYDRVTLIDTGGLYDVHHEYAERFRSFVENLSAEYGDGHPVERSVVEGNTSLLRSFLAVEAETSKRFDASGETPDRFIAETDATDRPDVEDETPDLLDVYPPGRPVE